MRLSYYKRDVVEDTPTQKFQEYILSRGYRRIYLLEADVEDACTAGLNSDVQGNDLVGGLTIWQGDNGCECAQDSLNVCGLEGCVCGDGLGLEGDSHRG